MARAQLIYTLLDEEGDAIPNRAVTFTKMDGSALGQSLYATESGGAPEVAHVTDSVGMLFRYADQATRALATPSGGAARSVQFDPDPGAILLSTDANLIYRNTASALDQYAGVDDYVLTIQPTSGGATGNKAFKVENNSGTTVLEVAAKGGGDAQVATYHNTAVGPFVVSPLRNWDTGADMFVNAVKLTGNPTGSHQVANFSYQTVAQPSDGFNGSANVPDHVVANFDYFAQNVASGASQNHDGSGRAIEIQTLVYAGTGKKRTMGAMSAGIHTAVDQISGVDVILAGSGTADTEYGSVGIYVHNGDQSAYTGYGTTVRGNMGFLTWGAYGYKQPYVALDVDNSLLWCVDKFGDTYSRHVLPRPGASATLGSSSRVWTQAWVSTVIAGNGSAGAPTVALLGAGGSSDGLFGSGSGGVVGIAIGSTEKGRWDATGLAVSAALRHNGASVITPTQLTANTDNWNPTGLATARILRVSSDASRNLTGIVAQAAGTVLSLVNIGAQNIVLKHEVTSTAANRFNLPADTDVTLGRLAAIQLYYDATATRWMKIA